MQSIHAWNQGCSVLLSVMNNRLFFYIKKDCPEGTVLINRSNNISVILSVPLFLHDIQICIRNLDAVLLQSMLHSEINIGYDHFRGGRR